MLVGRIMGGVRGLSYDDYVQRKIFAPAGMKSTGARPESEAVPGRAAGYLRRDGAWGSNADTLPFRGMAFGLGYSTARDLLQFVQALESGKLHSKNLLSEAPQPPPEEPKSTPLVSSH